MVEPEHIVLVLLREMRTDIAEAGAEVHAVEDRLNARLGRMEKRPDAMHLNGMKGFIGHRTMVERTMAHFDDQVSRPEQRVAALEAARP